MRRRPQAIIFDFDGVIADSEVIANRELARALTEIGLPTTFEECLERYYGRNWLACEQRIVAQLGGPLPESFVRNLRGATAERLERELTPVPGVAAFVDRRAALPKAIASSSERDYLMACLKRFGLAGHFAEHLYSAALLPRGKPFPDIYQSAARGLGVPAGSCLVIEDSPVGVRAGVAAGMTVVGLLAGGHVQDCASHGERLAMAGAHFVAASFDEVERWLEST